MNGAIESATNPINNGSTDTKVLASGASVALFGRIMNRAFQVAGQILLARLLGADAYGLYAIGFTVFTIMSFVIPVGMDNGVIHFGSRFWNKDAPALKTVLFLSISSEIISGVTWGLLFWLVAPWISISFGKSALVPIIRGFAITFPLFAVVNILTAATRISQRIKFSVLVEDITQPAICLVLVVAFYWMGYHLMGVVAAYALSYAIAGILAVLFVRQLFSNVLRGKKQPTIATKELLKYSIPVSLSVILNGFIIWTGRLLVGYFRPSADAGIYQAASQIALLFSTIVISFRAILSPMISDLHNKGEIGRLEEVYRIGTKWSLYVVLPAILVFLIMPREVILLFFGPEYIGGQVSLVILLGSQLVTAAVGDVSAVLVMTRKQNGWLLISAAAFALDIILSIILIPVWGIIGAAFATSISSAVLMLGGLLFIRRSVGIWLYDKRYFKGLGAAAGVFALLVGIKYILHSGLLAFATGLISSVIVFGALLWRLGLEREDQDFLRLMLARVSAIVEPLRLQFRRKND
jgi:O-antigen/teichoic acid export membrane protein